MAFSELKNRGIIESVVSKSYYVASEDIYITKKIVLLFYELCTFKEYLYNSLEYTRDNVNVYIHHLNKIFFNQFINDNLGWNNYFWIKPTRLDNTINNIKKLPSDEVYILGQLHENFHSYSAVYQKFYGAICNKLKKTLNLINNFIKIALIYSKNKQLIGIRNSFYFFLRNMQYPY